MIKLRITHRWVRKEARLGLTAAGEGNKGIRDLTVWLWAEAAAAAAAALKWDSYLPLLCVDSHSSLAFEQVVGKHCETRIPDLYVILKALQFTFPESPLVR